MAIAAVSYFLLLVIIFGGVLIPPEGYMIFGDDIGRQYYFFREFFNTFFHKGIIPWWNTYLFSGQPFMADPMVNMWYPATWLFIVMPLPVAYAWHIVIHIFWACLGMYALSRRFTKHTLSMWVSGVSFGLSGFFMARTWAGHVDVIASASWMPWVVLAFSDILQLSPEAGQRKKTIALASVVFAFQLLAGYQTMAFMTLIAVFVFALIRTVMTKTAFPLIRVILAGCIGIFLAAIHLVPVQEFFRQSIRTFRLPYSWVSYGSWGLESFIGFLQPFFFGDQRTYRGLPPNFIEHSVFLGITGVTLALVGVVFLITFIRKDAHKSGVFFYGCGFFCIALFGLWVSLGPNAPVDLQYILWRIVPMYHYLRIPPRHLVLVAFALSGLVGIGMDVIFRGAGKFRLLPLGVAGILVIELFLFGKHFIELGPVPARRHDEKLVTRLTQDREPYRVLQNFGVWLDSRDAMDFDSVMSYGIFSATGYDTSMLRSYYEYISHALGKQGSTLVLEHDVQVPYLTPQQADTIDALNIKYIMVPSQYDPFADSVRYRLIGQSDNPDYRLYENTTVFSRFYLMSPACGAVGISSYSPNRIELSVEATCDTTLMSSEVLYPGWTVYIDGKKSSYSSENSTFRTLIVSKGKHTVIQEYRPTIFYIGAGISGLTAMALFYWIRKKPKSTSV